MFTALFGCCLHAGGKTIAAPVVHLQQQATVTGKVTDEKGAPLIGVTVQVKGTQTVVVTDEAGMFSIHLPKSNATLVFSFVGYTSYEQAVDGRTDLGTIILKTSAASNLDEIVVIGYGTARKSDLTGSISILKSDKLMDAPVPNVTQALQGKVAG